MGAERKEYRWVGKRPIRPDGVDKVTGRAQFGADFALPNMLMASVLRSPHAHAHIRGIDTSARRRVAGGEGGDHRRRLARPAVRMEGRHPARVQHAQHVLEHHGQGQGSLRGPCGRRRGRHLGFHRRDGPGPDCGRLRGAASRDRPGRGHEARRAPTPRGHDYPQRHPAAGQALQHRQGDGVRPRRLGQGIFRGRGDCRAHLHHQGRAPGLHRNPCDGGQLHRGRADHRLEFVPGPVRRAGFHRHGFEDGLGQHPGHPGGDRRRLRRQDNPLSGAPVRAVVAQGPAAGEKRHEPRGRVPRHRPHFGRRHDHQDRRQEGRPHHRRRRHLHLSGRRLPRIACDERLHVRLRSLRHRQRAHQGLRRGGQPPQGGGLPGTRLAHLRFRGGKRHRRVGRGTGHCAPGVAPPERRPRGHQGRLRPHLRHHRLRRNRAGGHGTIPR